MRLDFENPWVLALAVALPLLFLILRYTLVDNPKMQIALSAAVRFCILLLLIAALAGALSVTRSKNLSLLVLADLSDSVPESATNQVRDFLAPLREKLPKNAQAGLMTFANAPELKTGLGQKPDAAKELTKPTPGTETSLERALLAAWQGMPADTVNRVAVLSDGNETLGSGVATAKRSAGHGVKVFTAPYTEAARDEVLLEDLIVPVEAKKGQSFSVSAIAHSAAPTKASFTLYRDGFKVQEREIELKAGANTLTFQESDPPQGLVKYELRVSAARDFYTDNNVASGAVQVAGEPRVLLLEQSEREARFLARALEAENIRVEVREGKGMPVTLDELAAYDCVILSDVPATDLSVSQMNSLRSYVEELGGGFIMVGGEQAFGLGGYYKTAVEEVLPVRMRPEKKKDVPSVAMSFIIDKSGSMNGQKIELAKEACIVTLDLLNDRDYVNVVAFDGAAYSVVDIQSAANRAAITRSIEQVQAGGGTSIYPGLLKGYEALTTVPAKFKHAVLLTDGWSQQGDYETLIGQMVADQITLTTVSIGTGAAADLLQNLARLGGGKHYATDDPRDIPQIFAKETMTASKSSLLETPFLPQVFRNLPVIRSIDWSKAPFLFGYVATSSKPTAEVSLLTEAGDPLLVTWRYGLGKTAAFTSDAKSRWGSDWVRWSGFGQFWAQVVREVMRTSINHGAEMSVTYQGNRGKIVIDNVDDQGQFVNELRSTAQVVKPDLSVESIALRQVAPGRYETDFPINATGSYLFKIRQTIPAKGAQPEQVFSDMTRAFTISYKPEYRHLGVNEDYLKELATVTGGGYKATPEDLFKVSDQEAVSIRRKLWPWFLGAALCLFILDVALRRLDLAGYRFFKPSARRYG